MKILIWLICLIVRSALAAEVETRLSEDLSGVAAEPQQQTQIERGDGIGFSRSR